MDEVQRFLAYVRSFDPDVPRIRLKQEHSLRVSALCAQLARRKGWCETEIALARQIGLLHDIGRFRQVVQYGTFVDGVSVSHAALGAKILFEEGWIRYFRFDASEDRLIRQVIRVHSDRFLPQGLSVREQRFAHLLRDGDKIDILRVHQEHPFTDYLDCTKEELAVSTVSDALIDAFLRHETLDHALRRTPLDILLSHDALVFGLHDPLSRQLFIETGCPLFSALEGIRFRDDTRQRLHILQEECRRCGFPVKEVL